MPHGDIMSSVLQQTEAKSFVGILGPDNKANKQGCSETRFYVENEDPRLDWIIEIAIRRKYRQPHSTVLHSQ